MAAAECARYRPRHPRATPLYRLVETRYEEVKAQWEERFERRYGFCRGFVDEQVRRYEDCGLFENGFVRIRTPSVTRSTSSRSPAGPASCAPPMPPSGQPRQQRCCATR